MIDKIAGNQACTLYEIEPSKKDQLRRIMVSTPETRAICNDPFVVGVRYTRMLQKACSSVLQGLSTNGFFASSEEETIVFTILRGGLNFGLREALADAFGWNTHGMSFISAQRARASHDAEAWHIVESDYKKVYVPRYSTAVLGDVVATGTSLQHALEALVDAVENQGAQLRHILFFTIGGPRSEEIMRNMDSVCQSKFKAYEGSILVYVEGRFAVPEIDSPLSIRVTGTDLVRRDALLTPEFIEAQYAQPSYPIERCAIYDAGSRAFWLPEYFSDIDQYWRHTLSLTSHGVTFRDLLEERFPTLDPDRFGPVDLVHVCEQQLDKIR
ncbi:MAG: phosphoribosyltransferase [Spartobacteria bacterium]|nr:phosphoribosyltransferase [Spartobacteria bacterium]